MLSWLRSWARVKPAKSAATTVKDFILKLLMLLLIDALK